MGDSTTTTVTKEALDRVDARLSGEIKENREHIKQNTAAIVKLETLYGTLVKLPDAIASLEKTVVGINHNLEALNSKIDHVHDGIADQKRSISELREENKQQNEAIDKVDQKSKIDWSHFITNNFWKIVVFLGALYFVVQRMIS